MTQAYNYGFLTDSSTNTYFKIVNIASKYITNDTLSVTCSDTNNFSEYSVYAEDYDYEDFEKMTNAIENEIKVRHAYIDDMSY